MGIMHSLRFMVLFFALQIIASTSLLAQSLVPAGHCAVVVASEPSLGAAKRYVASNGIDGFARVFESSNGYFAITIGMIPDVGSAKTLVEFKEARKIPDDSYCSKGGRLVREVTLPHIDPWVPDNTTAPAPAPVTPAPVDNGYTLYMEGDALVFQGKIGDGFAADLADKVMRHRPEKLAILGSPGGYVVEALDSAQLLRGWDVNTELRGNCASACVTLFAGGRERSIAKGTLGIHQSWTQNGLVSISGIQDSFSRMAGIYEAGGIDEGLVFEMMRIPADEMHWLSDGEVRNYGLVQ